MISHIPRTNKDFPAVRHIPFFHDRIPNFFHAQPRSMLNLSSFHVIMQIPFIPSPTSHPSSGLFPSRDPRTSSLSLPHSKLQLIPCFYASRAYPPKIELNPTLFRISFQPSQIPFIPNIIRFIFPCFGTTSSWPHLSRKRSPAS